MKYFKNILFTCLLAIAAYSAGAQNKLIDKVLAVVGDNIILQSEVEAQYQQLKQQNPDQPLPTDARCRIFDNLLMDKLFLAQAQLDSITVSQEEVESELDRRIKYFISMFGSKENLEEYYGKTVLELKDDFRDDIEKQLLTDKMKGKVFAGMKVSPAEVKSFFAKIPPDSIPYFNSELEIGQIVMFPKIGPAEKQVAYKKLDEVRNKIIGGMDFSIAATLYSEDPGSYLDGGALGTVARGEMVPEFEGVLFKLKEGEISPIFETQFGYHIAIVDEIRGEKRKARHILIKPKTNPYDLIEVKKTMDSVLHELRVDSLSWREAVKVFSEDESSKSIGGMLTNSKNGTTFFEKADIDGTLIFTIDRMKVGDYSDVLSYNSADRTGQQKQGYRIIWLKTETKPHKANLDEDYPKIQEAAKAEKQQKLLETWLKLHIENNYVRIDDSMKGCAQMEKWLKKSSN